MKRAPIDTSGGRPTTNAELQTALLVVRRSGVLEVLEPAFANETGRKRTLPILAFLVAAQLNAMARHHVEHIAEIARVLNALTDDQRARLGISRWHPADAYARVDRCFLHLCQVLEADADHDDVWFANALANAAIPDDVRLSGSVAVDGTDLETWAALHGDPETVELDGEAADTQLVDDGTVPKKKRGAVRKAKVFGVGADGRNIYTKDIDARAGHRSATGSRPAGPYLGYELHLGVQARDLAWTNGVDKARLGPDVPNVITAISLVPAGTHRAKAIVPLLAADPRTTDVVWDPGYSMCRPETAMFPLAAAGIHTTFTPASRQRGIRPFGGDALLIDGHLFSSHMPEELRELPMPPRGARLEEKEQYEARFNLRAAWRYMRHAGPDTDGATRWRCPFDAGLLRSRKLPKTMRRAKTTPLVDINADRCCDGTLTAQAADLPLWQRCLPGTTAWRICIGRRQVVESVNAALQGVFCDIGRGFLRVFGKVKAQILLAFSVAAFNLDRIRAYRAKQRAEAEPKPRTKRRRGTWTDLVEASDVITAPQRAAERGSAPPG